MTERCDDYCCNHGCNQGRNCPARVAKIGRRDYTREELPPTVWRRQLMHLAKWALAVISLLFYAALLSAVLS